MTTNTRKTIRDTNKINKSFIQDIANALGLTNEIKYVYTKSPYGSYEYNLNIAGKNVFVAHGQCGEPLNLELYTKWLKHRMNDVCSNEKLNGYNWATIAGKILKYLNAKELNDTLTLQLNNNKPETKKALKI